MFDKIFGKHHKKETKVKIIGNLKKKFPQWQGPVFLIEVESGKNILRTELLKNHKKHMLALMFEDVPLVKLHGDDKFCCTCKKKISLGYGLDRIKSAALVQQVGIRLNEAKSSEDALSEIIPVLEILPSGYYAVADMKLSPTDGEGNFFWKQQKITGGYRYCGDVEYINKLGPSYIIPTQSPISYNPHTVEYYRSTPGLRALSYFLKGGLCALLDGHNKATAASVSGIYLNSIVIIPAGINIYYETLTNEQMSMEPVTRELILRGRKANVFIDFAGYEFEPEKLGISLLKPALEEINITERLFDNLLSITDETFSIFEWDKKILESASGFSTAAETIATAVSNNISRKMIDRINSIIDKDKIFDPDQILHIAESMYIIKSPKFIDLAFHICLKEKHYGLKEHIFKMLSHIKDERVQFFFTEALSASGNEASRLLSCAKKLWTGHE